MQKPGFSADEFWRGGGLIFGKSSWKSQYFLNEKW